MTMRDLFNLVVAWFLAMQVDGIIRHFLNSLRDRQNMMLADKLSRQMVRDFEKQGMQVMMSEQLAKKGKEPQ